jgi:hypothetical protein
MKTPREILLGRHQTATTKLDAIRAEVVAGIGHQPPQQTLSWRDWLWPCPQAWAGLAAAWMVILGMNLAVGKNPSGPATATLAVSLQVPMELRRQQQMLARLIAPRATAEAEQPKPVMSPRSDRRKTTVAV